MSVGQPLDVPSEVNKSRNYLDNFYKFIEGDVLVDEQPALEKVKDMKVISLSN